MRFGASNFGYSTVTGRGVFGLITSSGLHTESSTQYQVGEAFAPNLLVLRMTYDPSGPEQFDLFLNPTPGLAAPDVSVAASLSFELPGIDSISYASGTGPSGMSEWSFDEVRIAKTYSEAAPAIPEPANVALLVLGSGALLARRRRA